MGFRESGGTILKKKKEETLWPQERETARHEGDSQDVSHGTPAHAIHTHPQSHPKGRIIYIYTVFCSLSL